MEKLKLNPNNKKYYSDEFIKGFECGVERQFNVDMAENTTEQTIDELEYLKADIRFQGFYNERIEDLINNHISVLKGDKQIDVVVDPYDMKYIKCGKENK